MATGDSWSREEVDACVADYLQMLALELTGQRYNKSAHATALMQKLDGRSRGSVEFKHCNISAVLLDLGWPAINGYKRRDNVQGLLLEAVEAQLAARPELQDAAQAFVSRPAIAVDVTTALHDVWIDAPVATHVRETPPEYAPRFSTMRRDYLAQEARNRSLGHAGELFVADIEARRLHAAGKKALAGRVEHVAATQGDGLGYDVRSFEDNGRERLIEVKTTAFGQLTPFFVSRNELARSQADAAHYQLYRLFDFRERPRVFALPGAINAHCRLDPVSFMARIDS